MGINALFLEISHFLSQIKWENIISLFVGAFISAYMSYKFLKRRESVKLKKDLQIKAAEEILAEMHIVSDKNSKLFIPDITAFHGYNSFIGNQNAHKDDSIHPYSKMTIDELNHNQIEQAKKRITECMDSYFKFWNEFAMAFCHFSITFEARYVILNKFIGIKELLDDKLTEAKRIEENIMHVYHFDMFDFIASSKLIDERIIDKIQEFDKQMLEKRTDIMAIFYDLKVGLQNEFLGELFKYKIPERQPKDKEKYKVYKGGYKHTSE